MNRIILTSLLLSASLFSSTVLSATPVYERINLSIVPDVGIGYSHTFYVPYDNKKHYFYFDQKDSSLKETTDGSFFDKNTDSDSTYFTFTQVRNPNTPEKDNTYFNIHYKDYNNNNCLVESTAGTVFYNNPYKTISILKSCTKDKKTTYKISLSLS